MRRDIDQPRRPVPADLDPTRARPEPWFLGGPKSAIAKLLTVGGVVLLAHAFSLLRLGEDAWRWWRQSGVAPVARAVQPDRVALPPLPPNLIPPVDPAKRLRPPRGNPGAAFGSDDYPPEALRAGQQGRTAVRLGLDASGTPISCIVTASSGSASLDAATCNVARARVRFEPARDQHGAPIPSIYPLKVRWVLPDQ